MIELLIGSSIITIIGIPIIKVCFRYVTISEVVQFFVSIIFTLIIISIIGFAIGLCVTGYSKIIW